ncbi:hypothetical protein [Jannaschia pohangensis]|uniref:Tetratricopeptide repeat-containing protein n=1 Tax=Jannaschia pohangensis TaxID=390807 RepID=A0A1I3R6T4_9RHOB|nr:hypothetical protein [Jannaschia pohangensis]SFJ42313.1 hypothetical protein SAMN04488095_2820 [Jannaschia pohangensis]
MTFGAVRVLAFGVFLLPCSALAESVQLRSGEHDGFSRLVFADEPDQTWQIDRPTERRVEIRFSAREPELDVSRVFDLIPRDRIRDIAYESGILSLDLACDCGVDVSQIPTGHVVIDVGDGDPDSPAGQTIAVRSIPVPLQGLSLDLVPSPAEPKTGPRLAQAPLRENTPSQVRVQPLRIAPLILPEQSPEAEASTMTCSLEQRAAGILNADPDAALAQLTEATSSLLDGQDLLEEAAIERLADLYLSAGWGAEAIAVLQAGKISDTERDVIASALDNTVPRHSSIVDPGCGAAATTLALLIGTDRELWARSDQSALVRFLADLPDTRWKDLETRIANALASLSAEDLLIGLHKNTVVPDPGPDLPDLAGTDAAAIDAVLRLFEQAAADGEVLDETNLVNALALLPSVPPGPQETAMREGLALALLKAGHMEDALKLVESDPVQTEILTEHALATLAPGLAVEFAMRARSRLPISSPVRARAAALLEGFGLSSLAGAYAPRQPRPVQDVPSDAAIVPDPWLSRDYASLLETEDVAARKAVAALILDRDATIDPEGDLAAAELILSESQQMSAAISELLQDPAVQ